MKTFKLIVILFLLYSCNSSKIDNNKTEYKFQLFDNSEIELTSFEVDSAIYFVTFFEGNATAPNTIKLYKNNEFLIATESKEYQVKFVSIDKVSNNLFSMILEDSKKRVIKYELIISDTLTSIERD